MSSADKKKLEKEMEDRKTAKPNPQSVVLNLEPTKGNNRKAAGLEQYLLRNYNRGLLQVCCFAIILPKYAKI